MAKTPKPAATPAATAAPEEGISTAEMFPVRETTALTEPVTLAQIEDGVRELNEVGLRALTQQVRAAGKGAFHNRAATTTERQAFRSALSEMLGAREERFSVTVADRQEALGAIVSLIRDECPPGRSPLIGSVEVAHDDAGYHASVTVRFV